MRTSLGQVVASRWRPTARCTSQAATGCAAVSPSGEISTVAGDGRPEQCKLANGTIATHASIGSPGIAVSPTGRLYLPLGCASDVAVLRGRRLHLVLVPASFIGADPLYPEDREPGPSDRVDHAGDLYIGGYDPYAVFAPSPRRPAAHHRLSSVGTARRPGRRFAGLGG